MIIRIRKKTSLRIAIAIGIATAGFLALGSGLGHAANLAESQSSAEAATPGLIDAALEQGEIDEATANLYLAFALGEYEELPEAYRSDVPWDGTLPLLGLQKSLAGMPPSMERTTIERLLKGSCSTSSSSLPNTSDSTNFHTEYDTIGGGLDINAYVTSLESSWTGEVTTFGWAAPPVLTANPPPGNRYHVRIDALGGGLYGYVSSTGVHAGLVGNNPNTAWDDVDAVASCMVLNNNYSGFPGSPQRALDATTAHEFNHSIQFGYGGLSGANTPDSAFIEGGATWMEDEVFDSSNDNYNYLWPTFSSCMGQYTASPYPYWITFRGLTEPYGTGVAGGGEQIMQDFWEITSQNTGSNLAALDTALTNAGTNLPDAYHAFGVAAAFTKTCGGGYASPYCFEEASGYVGSAGTTSLHGTVGAVGGSYNGSVADNYALNWVGLPTSGGSYSVTLRNNASGGTLRGSVVCDTGSALQVNAIPGTAGPGGSVSLASFNPSGCTEVIGVITNQSQTADNPGFCMSRSYALETGTAGSFPYKAYLPLVARDFSPGGTPAPTPTPTPILGGTPSPTPTPTPISGGGIANGDFESGPSDWTEFSQQGWPIILTPPDLIVTPHSGIWAAWLGGDNNEIAYIEQQVTVPAGSPYLAYWHWIDSEDFCGYDFGGVLVNGTVVDGYDLCSSENTGGWVKYVVDLSAYQGQSVALQIRAETDPSGNSNLFVDDVAFQSSPTREQGADQPPFDGEPGIPKPPEFKSEDAIGSHRERPVFSPR